jgi:N-acetylneuraminate lyase
MHTQHLQGLIAAPFTPMQPDGSLKLSLIPRYYQMLKANHVTGAFICGSTGEGVSMTTEEKRLVTEAWAAAANGDPDFKIITLLGGTSIRECQQLALHAWNAGLYGVAITAPFYFKPGSVKTLAEICLRVGEQVPDLPFYYYHIPVLTGVNFPMIHLLQELDGRMPNFAGIKYTHEDFMDFLSCMQFRSGNYDMLWGRDECLLSALVLGCKGGVGSTFNYAAPLYYDMMTAFEKGDLEKARALQQRSIDMIRLLGKYGGIATGKAYMKAMGLDVGEFRLPVKNMAPDQYDRFLEEVSALHFSSFSSRLPEAVNL